MKLSGKFGRGPGRKSLTGTISPLRSLHTSNARVYTAHCASSSLGHPAGREFGKPSCGMGTIPQRRKRSGSRAGTGPGDARKPPSAGAGDGSKGEDAPQRIPAKPLPRVPTARAGPSPPGGPRLGGAKQRAQPQRRLRPEPIGPRPLLPPPVGQPAGRASRRARVEPPKRPRARAPARSGRSPDVPAAPARAHPAPSRAAPPSPSPGSPADARVSTGVALSPRNPVAPSVAAAARPLPRSGSVGLQGLAARRAFFSGKLLPSP